MVAVTIIMMKVKDTLCWKMCWCSSEKPPTPPYLHIPPAWIIVGYLDDGLKCNKLRITFEYLAYSPHHDDFPNLELTICIFSRFLPSSSMSATLWGRTTLRPSCTNIWSHIVDLHWVFASLSSTWRVRTCKGLSIKPPLDGFGLLWGKFAQYGNAE